MTPITAVISPMITGAFGILFVFIYFAFIIGVAILVFWLANRFVGAHERMAASLDIIARKLKDDARP